MSEFKITPEMVEAASVETERLTRELDIMNADHIALWLEANDPYDGDAWLAIQIIEAHERATTTLRAENELMREALGYYRDHSCEGYCDGFTLRICQSIQDENLTGGDCYGCRAAIALAQVRG